MDGRCFLCNFMVDLFWSPHEQLERAFQLRSYDLTSTPAAFTALFFGLFFLTRAGGRVRVEHESPREENQGPAGWIDATEGGRSRTQMSSVYTKTSMTTAGGGRCAMECLDMATNVGSRPRACLLDS